VREPFEFTVEGGDYRSRRYRVEVIPRPRLESLTLRRVFPDYIGFAPAVDDAVGAEIAVPNGTRLEFAAVASKPLESAQLRTAEEAIAMEIESGDRRRFAGQLEPVADGTLEVFFRDRDGVIPDERTTVHIALVADRAPVAKLASRGVGALVSPAARIPLVVEASDDYRIVELALEHETVAVEVAGAEDGGAAPSEPRESKGRTPIAGVEPDALVQARPVFELAEHAIGIGVRLRLRVEATDNDALTGPKQGRSAELEFLVVSSQRLMDELLRRQEEQRQAFERVVEMTRGARDALYEALAGDLKRPGPVPVELGDTLDGLGRQERALATQCLSIAAAIEAILEEMLNNRVGAADDLARLGAKVVDPLRAVAADDLPAVATGLESLRGFEAPAERIQEAFGVSEQIEDTLERMESILASMVKLEGFTEVVNRLRAIIDVQGASRKALEAAYNRLLDSVFEEDAPPPAGAVPERDDE
jgi:hypothetical protein